MICTQCKIQAQNEETGDDCWWCSHLSRDLTVHQLLVEIIAIAQVEVENQVGPITGVWGRIFLKAMKLLS